MGLTKLKKAGLVRLVRHGWDLAVGFVATLWKLADGHKTSIVAIYLALQRARPEWPVWQYVDAVAIGLGWDHVAPAVDPNELLTFVMLAVALGHRGVKLQREFRAGIPLAEVGQSPLDQSVAVIRMEPGAAPLVVPQTTQEPPAATLTEKVIVETAEPAKP